LSFDRYRDIVKEVIHPAGLEFFGEIVITSTVSLAANFTSEIAADKAPRLTTLFSFFSLFDGIGFPPANQQSIVVRIKPFVSYTDNAKLDTHREINLEIAPTVINVAALTSTEYRPIIAPSIDIGVFGSSTVEAIPVSPGQNELDVILQGTTIAVDLTTGSVRKINIEPSAANLQISWVAFEDLNIPKQINFAGAVLDAIPTAQYEIDIQSVRAKDTSLLPYVWGDFFTLGEYAEIVISQFANQTFDEPVYGIGSTRNEYNIEFSPTVINQGVDVFGTEEFPLIKTLVTDVTDVTSDLAEVSYKIDLNLNLPIQLEFNTNPFIQINSFADATMEFYSSIISMQTNITTTEVDIELFKSVSSSVSTSYKIETETFASVITTLQPQKFVIQPNSFIDATLAFYSDIVTMQNEIRTTEIDIELFKSISSSISNSYKIETETFASVTTLQLQKFVIQPNSFIDATMEFYSSIISMQNEIRTTEIDIPLFKSVTISATPKLKIDIFNHVGTPEFVNGNEDYFYKDVRLRQFRDTLISEVQNLAFNMISGDDTVRKNIPTGLASTPTIQYQEVSLSFFAEDSINNYSANTFGESSNLRPFVLGSNTTFLDDFLVNDYIVVADEKFIIKAISNNTFLEINVSAAQNHNNVPSYREIFV
jgi:predicted nucleic-acid-binding protein